VQVEILKRIGSPDAGTESEGKHNRSSESNPGQMPVREDSLSGRISRTGRISRNRERRSIQQRTEVNV